MAENGAPIVIEGSLVEGSAQADASGKSGMVTVDLIREGFGNRRDQHYYTAQVLKEAAPSFIGAQMYANHLSPELQEKLKGLPRNIQDLMGRIRETEVVVEDGVTIVRGVASISQKWLWDMVEHDPGLLGVSINARGRSVAGQKDGRTAKIVEAISTVGSVDWVSQAGAGGKVFALMEAQAEEEAGGESGETDTGESTETDETSTEETAEEAAAEAATQTHHHHHHHKSAGAGKHVHHHSHKHPDAVAGETNTHSELTEAPVSEADAATETAAVVQHHHDHIHKGSLGKGKHLHIHHHHHTLVAGESHTHQGETSGAAATTESESAPAGEEETPAPQGTESAPSTETPTDADAASTTAPEDGTAEEETTEAAGSAVHHHYHNHDSMGRGLHRHHHHHKAVEGETHEHVTSGSSSSSSRFNEPSSMGEHNHHHHHASMGTGHHIHHHTHNLVPGEAHQHSVEPLLEAGAEEGEEHRGEEMFDEAQWIAGAIKHKGQLHRDLGVPEGEKIPIDKLKEAAKRKDKIGKRARLALTLMKMHHPAHATEADVDEDWADGDTETVEAEIDRRAAALAADKLKEGVKSAIDISREQFDKKLKEAVAENDWKWERKVGQLEHRQLAAALIEKADFQPATERALKAEFYDAYFEDKCDDSGAVLKPGEEICREAVKARIQAKRDELREFTGTRISEAGETTESQRPGGQRQHTSSDGEELPKKAPLDAKLDEALAIPAGAGTDNR